MLQLIRPAQYTARTNSDLVAEFLAPIAKDWTPVLVYDLIASGTVPDEWMKAMLAAIGKNPKLAFLSDDDFIRGMDKINPTLANIFRTPSGLDWMHNMSAKIATRKIQSFLGFGG